MKQHFYSALLFSLLSFAPLTAQTIRYVNGAAFGGSSDGTSWANAFTRLQQALSMAQDGDEIWVAKGTYKPTSGLDRFVYYNLPSGVAVYGGFAGNETQRTQRDWTANPTILSGDIGIIGDSTDNSYNVLYSYSPNDKTRLDGLIIEEGNANNTDNSIDYQRPTRSGGGVYLDGEGFGYAQLSIANCIFRHNRAFYQGGGMYINGREGGVAIARMEHCLFERNVSKTFGGAFALENYFEQPFDFEVKDCEFRENYSRTEGNVAWLRANQEVRFINCIFTRNSGIIGHVVHFGQAAMLYPLRFDGCKFYGNSSYSIFYYPTHLATGSADFSIKSCLFYGNELPNLYLESSFAGTDHYKARIDHCIFYGNHSPQNESSSAVVLPSMVPGATANILNCLFYQNIGMEISTIDSVHALVNNSILINELSGNDMQVFGNGSTITVSHSLFHAQDCAHLGGFNTQIICNPNNLFGITDPGFVIPSTGLDADFHLLPCSPAINAGGNAILDSLGITTDYEGHPRIRNGVVDIGPYESHISLHPGVSAEPACAGQSNGSIALSPEICPPFSFVWSNGSTTGTNTDGLAAGTYVFTATGSNNIPVHDTIAITEPAPLILNTTVSNANCYHSNDGAVLSTAEGGTPPYTYHWDTPLTFNLAAGTYHVTATDTHGCSITGQATVNEPDPIQVFYTVIDATGANHADGAILFDSISGGTNLPLPTSLNGLLPGNYAFTITDDANCFTVINVVVGYTSGTSTPATDAMLQLYPNPTPSGSTTALLTAGPGMVEVRILDGQGNEVGRKTGLQGNEVHLNAYWPAGVYRIEIVDSAGRRSVVKWVIV